MTLANKLTISRFILTFIIIGILLLPLDSFAIDLPKLFINEALVVDIKYFIAGILFILAFITDLLDGYIARKRNEETELGKVLDSVADKMIVDSLLIILASLGFIHAIYPIVIVSKDVIIDGIKKQLNLKGIEFKRSEKISNFILMLAITFTLFYNLPFELWNLRVADFLLMISCVFAIISSCEYHGKIMKTKKALQS